MPEQATDVYASPDESEIALKQLKNADLVRLRRIIQNRFYGLPYIEWEEVLGEAVVRILSGTRRWPKNVSLIKFLAGVMSSLVNEHWKQHYRRKEANVVTEADVVGDCEEENYEGPVARVGDMSRNPEAEVLAGEVLVTIETLFEDDPTAWGIVVGKSEGLSPREIQDTLEITSIQYASALKKIQRRLFNTNKKEKTS